MKKTCSLLVCVIITLSLLCSCNQNSNDATAENYNIELKTEKETYTTDTEAINYTITNNCDDKVIMKDSDPVIEKYVNGQWEKLDLRFSTFLDGYTIDPKCSLDFKWQIYDDDTKVEKGKYRISETVRVFNVTEEVTKTVKSTNDEADTYYKYDGSTEKKYTISDEYTIE